MAVIAATAAAKPGVAPRWAARFGWATLIWNVAVVLWGAYVRASQSGAGCGAHWPTCNGEVVPHGARWHTYVEFTHRVSSGIALLLVVALLAIAFRQTPRRHLARWTAALAAFFMFNEALLGALLVLLRKVEMDKSWGRAVYLCLHSSNTLLLLGAISLTAHFLATSPQSASWARLRRSQEWLVISPGLIGTLWLATTGAIAALGDTLFPATSLHQALAQDFAANAHYTLRLRGLHPLSAIAMLAFVAWLVLRRFQREDRVWRAAILPLFLLQFALGVADLFQLAPIWLQILHLLGADIFWIALVLASARILEKNSHA